jgi:hypothetical protein
MELNAGNGIVGARLSEFVMTRLASKASTSGRGLLTFQLRGSLTARCSGSGPSSPDIQRKSGCRIEAFRDNYRVRSGFLDNDGFDHKSRRPYFFPRGFLYCRVFGLGPGNRSLRRLRSLGHPTCLTAFS